MAALVHSQTPFLPGLYNSFPHPPHLMVILGIRPLAEGQQVSVDRCSSVGRRIGGDGGLSLSLLSVIVIPTTGQRVLTQYYSLNTIE